MKFAFILAVAAAIAAGGGSVRTARAQGGDYEALQDQWDRAALNLLTEGIPLETSREIGTAARDFERDLSDPALRSLWASSAAVPAGPLDQAEYLGRWRGRAEQTLAVEMLRAHARGDVEAALEWRALMKLPKYGETVDGTLALHRIGRSATQRTEVARLLASEYLLWQSTRVREKAGYLRRLVLQGRHTPEILAMRSAEVEELANFPAMILEAAGQPYHPPEGRAYHDLRIAAEERLPSAMDAWISTVETRLPNLLTAEDAARRENLLLKLLRLIPMEYSAGIKEGQIVIPIEYREAVAFAIKAAEIVSELQPVWRKERAQPLEEHGDALRGGLERLESLIARKEDPREVERQVKAVSALLQSEFGISLRKAGTAGQVIEEVVLEVRTLLGQSLRAAEAANWREAEALRLEAYTTFDLEIESRVLPRDPNLAIEVEKLFLDGAGEKLGIKAALDARKSGPPLHAAYEAALQGVEKCRSMLSVGLSPATAVFSTVSIVLREGLEAVVILAALLAGLRGRGDEKTRKGIVAGVWLALAFTAVTFVASRYVVVSLSRYGERVEAVVSVLAVIILLIVTNWVAHKYYWAGWNARLQKLGRSAAGTRDTRWEWLALIGVGFVTVYREGFETVLFLQTLLLEGGLKPVALGIAIGGAAISILGWLVFRLGMKLPYRRMLVFTGILVVTILTSFLGSSVRLFQTVGWLPIHPITWLDLPSWLGVWFGIYPSWEGIVIPLGGLLYVAGAWGYVKWMAKKNTPTVSLLSAPQAGPSTPIRPSQGSDGDEKRRQGTLGIKSN